MANSLVSIQIIPKTERYEDVIPYVDAAIAMIEAAGFVYRVGPLETTMEGELTQLLLLIEKMNEKMVEMGAISVISQVKIFYNPQGAAIETLTGKYDK
ncbi:MAG: thiamine-binding protein [Solibacillus sp.]